MLVGFALFGIRLRGVDSGKNRLVKIEELVGGNGMPDDTKTPNTEQEETTEPEVKDEQETENVREDKPVPNKTITVTVHATSIFLNGNIVVGMPFEEQFSKVYDGSQKVLLQDDFADYLTYCEVRDYLISQGIVIEEGTL
jgi:hypothetical protein